MSLKCRSAALLRNIAFLAALPCMMPAQASAHSYKVIHDFCAEAACTDGKAPLGLVRGPSGDLYGVTPRGGTHDGGTAFSLTPQADGSWVYRVLHNFCHQKECRDSFEPSSTPIVDTGGSVYGTTIGPQFEDDFGIIWRLKPNADRSAWSFSVLHRFNIPDGFLAESAPTYFGAASGQPYDGVSPLYGVTANGGSGFQGVVYEIKPKPGTNRWHYRKIHEFCVSGCADGALPYAELLMSSPSRLIGVTAMGGASSGGTVFSLDKTRTGWNETVLHSFCGEPDCADGDSPLKGVTADAQADLYGTTEFGGNACAQERGCGVLYKLTQAGEYSVLHAFCTKQDCADGFAPRYQPTLDPSGGVWGTTNYGGRGKTDPRGLGGGTVFQFDGRLHKRHDFCLQAQCSGGAYPNGGLLPDGTGGFFGTTAQGGAHGMGTVFEFTP